ncbi:hypothetical protein B0A52_10391 [Exophiala mesophila]|uniref:VWFA domain-containing protein n=1 Tax=Exophiala mesophila TaxID=212818 RepID=A0A438MRM3_EXOME|nr:hypothetical protein B0A52_10391 [Exophiala mesophila]
MDNILKKVNSFRISRPSSRRGSHQDVEDLGDYDQNYSQNPYEKMDQGSSFDDQPPQYLSPGYGQSGYHTGGSLAGPSSSDAAPPPLYVPQDAGDSPYEGLRDFDTVLLIDDSGSMQGSRWRETSAAIQAIAPICTEFDRDGIELYFLNHKNKRDQTRRNLGGYRGLRNSTDVQQLFSIVTPSGYTPTGRRLKDILTAYLDDLENSLKPKNRSLPPIKPLNLIVITDGEASDDVESPIVKAAKRLDKLQADACQVGIQFFQVGNDAAATESLQDLDDVLENRYRIRDMVDTVPFQQDRPITAEFLLKVCLGSVNRRLDRRVAK